MIEFTVKPDTGDEFKVEATSRDVYVWEKITKSHMGQLQDNISMTAMYSLAHLAAKRQQLFNGSLDEFTQTCDLDFDDMPEPGPTRPEASPES